MFSETVITDKIPVLLVEDSRNEAHVTQRLLHDIDNEFDISRVARLEDALAELTLHKMDAVILDLGLPDSDGPQSIQKINTHFPNLPIIVLSGRNDPDTVRRAPRWTRLSRGTRRRPRRCGASRARSCRAGSPNWSGLTPAVRY